MFLPSLFSLLSTPSASIEHPIPPPPVDTYRALVGARSPDPDELSPYDDFLSGARRVLSEMMARPDDPYSDPLDDTAWMDTSWWHALTTRLSNEGITSDRVALVTLQHQLGATKARPGREIDLTPDAIERFGNPYTAANARKAGIDADLFERARRRHPTHTTRAAAEAVAVQLIRDRASRASREYHAALNIRDDLVERYLDDRDDPLSAADRHHLGEVLRHATYAGQPSFNAAGERQLPAAYRVARVAAAYADSQGDLRPGGYCKGTEPRRRRISVRAHHLAYRPLCFVAATDRAVYDWYLKKAAFDSQRMGAASSVAGQGQETPP
ncbi:hypothetical protein P3W24_00105 [Luteibacter sp. PPL201]|uniref:Uncharacterized protein n=1 Tax=Luteibacter sahnii TaxID=3021977 RepID=A0ABT6B5G5_9GAMM